jgi:hypothetical protein
MFMAKSLAYTSTLLAAMFGWMRTLTVILYWSYRTTTIAPFIRSWLLRR